MYKKCKYQIRFSYFIFSLKNASLCKILGRLELMFFFYFHAVLRLLLHNTERSCWQNHFRTSILCSSRFLATAKQTTQSQYISNAQRQPAQNTYNYAVEVFRKILNILDLYPLSLLISKLSFRSDNIYIFWPGCFLLLSKPQIIKKFI